MTPEQREQQRPTRLTRAECQSLIKEIDNVIYHSERYDAAIADRDKWKARAEALETALIKLSGHCDSCVNFPLDYSENWQCDKVITDFSCWEFNIARFSAKEDAPCND